MTNPTGLIDDRPLLPWPFCGGKAKVEKRWEAGGRIMLRHILCSVCKIELPMGFKKAAMGVAVWNRRCPPVHWSDCALHNGPAEIPKPCDCGGDPGMTPEKYGSEFPV